VWHVPPETNLDSPVEAFITLDRVYRGTPSNLQTVTVTLFGQSFIPSLWRRRRRSLILSGSSHGEIIFQERVSALIRLSEWRLFYNQASTGLRLGMAVAVWSTGRIRDDSLRLREDFEAS